LQKKWIPVNSTGFLNNSENTENFIEHKVLYVYILNYNVGNSKKIPKPLYTNRS